jgi:hypothetical protein
MRVVAWIVVLGGCGGGAVQDEMLFEAEFAERWCARQQECALGDFERTYESSADCWTDKEDDPDIRDADKGCDMDPDGATECLEFLSTTDCASWEENEVDRACENVFRC